MIYTDRLVFLNKAYRWNVDVMQCRGCGRRQQVSWREHDFLHREGCKYTTAEPKPWLELCAVVNDAPKSGQREKTT